MTKVSNMWLQDEEFTLRALTEAQRCGYYNNLLDHHAPLSSQLFEDAVEHIKTHGWGQGACVARTGAVCAIGALELWRVFREHGNPMRTTRDEERSRIVAFRQADIVKLMGIEGFSSIVAWNDRPGRTKDEVIDALILAAKTLREQGR